MKSEVTPSVGMLLWWSVSWAGKLYRIITSSVREKHPAMLTTQSTLWERDCQGYSISFPLPCSDQKANMAVERTTGCGRLISSAISLKSQYSFVSSHVRLTQQKDHVAQGAGKSRNTRVFPTEGLAWHKKPQAASLPHSPKDTAIAQHMSS